MAINWTIAGAGATSTGKSSVYIDFSASSITYTPDTINATNGGVVMNIPMGTTGDTNTNIFSASANDYVNLNGYNGDTLYCSLYQISNTGTTAYIDTYSMSLTLTEIGPSPGITGPIGITATAYDPYP
jgi:hypothetical protein